MTHRIHLSAKRRLVEIWEYTEKTWGSDQADRYIEGLFAELERLARNRHLWKQVKERGFEGIFFAKYQHHFIFFLDLEDTLGVITVLHEAMDLPSRLREDTEGNTEHRFPPKE